MNSIVKPMELKDLPSVTRLCAELGYPASPDEIKVRFLELQTLPNHLLMVIGDGQGWIHLEIVFDLIEAKKVEIKALVVDEKFRGQGLGKKLLQASREWAEKNGLDTIYLSCNIIRDRAHAFYLREGFIKNKTSHFFELKF